jgi:hypothetical protein
LRILERLAPQVVAVELLQIEGHENDVLVVATMPLRCNGARISRMIGATFLAKRSASALVLAPVGMERGQPTLGTVP